MKCQVKVSFCKFCKHKEVEVNLHSFLHFALKEGRWSAWHPGTFSPGQRFPYLSEAGRAPEMGWKLRKIQIFCAIWGYEPRFFDSSIRSLVTMPTEPSRLLMWLWRTTLNIVIFSFSVKNETNLLRTRSVKVENLHVDSLLILYKVLSPHSNAKVLFVIPFAKSVTSIPHNFTVFLYRWLHRASRVASYVNGGYSGQSTV
jgi:hypothetical protein